MISPRATYRLQLSPGFGFDEAAALAPYLADLGISHVYFSPYLAAAPGSAHGYDVVDHSRVNEELGGSSAHARLCAALAQHGLGQIVDVVPNHMAIGESNELWWDILENGPSSRYAHFFDVDWASLEERQKNKVLLPILGDHYGRVLEAGEVRVARDVGRFIVQVYDKRLPASPRSVAELLASAAREVGSKALLNLAERSGALPEASATDHESVLLRQRDKTLIAEDLEQLLRAEPQSAVAVDGALARLSSDLDALDAFLDRQNYRLAFWRAARHDGDYRRFFDVNELAALRVENAEVFERAHRSILDWVEEGIVGGLRVDHIDGLYDPDEYFARLRRAAPSSYIVAEKILAWDESLPGRWPVDGTTGYDFSARITALFVDPTAEHELTELCSELTRMPHVPFAALARDKKRRVLREGLTSDLSRLERVFRAVCERHRAYRDYGDDELRDALEAMLVALPVYRTYLRAGVPPTETDLAVIERARATAGEQRPDLDPRLLDFLQELLSGALHGQAEAELVARFQQLSGPATAKGVEDTALWCDTRLLALNDVGSDPAHFGIGIDQFHAFCATLQRDWPASLVATSTHDTKRSEDVRLRIALISENVSLWRQAVQRWSALATRHRSGSLPDRMIEYVFHQTLLGAWPISEERLREHLLKAAREAKLHTSWTSPNAEYENALDSFVKGCMSDADLCADVGGVVAGFEPAFRVHALSQALLKLTVPGVPDIYQGNELFHFTLTDPDNRRPIDFARRKAALAALDQTDVSAMLKADDGSAKLWLTRQALQLRRRMPEVFGRSATYEPMQAIGRHRGRVVAFARSARVVTIAPRLVSNLASWVDTAIELPAGRYTNVLTGEQVASGRCELAVLLRGFPVALLEREGA